MKPPTPIRVSALRPWRSLFSRPKGREHHPQDRRPGVGDRDPEIGDADLPADRRHDRLQRGIARRGDQHRRVKQQEMRRRQRGSADAADRIGAASRRLERDRRRRKLLVAKTLRFMERRAAQSAGRSWETCQAAALLPTLSSLAGPSRSLNAISTARTLKGPRRFIRRAAHRAASPHWQFLRGFLKHPVMVGSIIPSSRVLIDKMLGAGRLGRHQAVRRIWPGRRHLHPADPRQAAAPMRS